MIEGLDRLAEIQVLREAAQRPPAEMQQMRQLTGPGQEGLAGAPSDPVEIDPATELPVNFSPPANNLAQIADNLVIQKASASPKQTADFLAGLYAFRAGSDESTTIGKGVQVASEKENLDVIKDVAKSLPNRVGKGMPTMPRPIQEEIQVSEAPSAGLASIMTMKEGGSLGQLDNKSLEDLRKAILIRESSGNYSAINKQGFAGGYQFGAAALETLGYLKKGSSKKGNKALKNSKNWTGKGNVKNLNEFLKNEKLQDKIFKDNAKFNYRQLKKNNYLFPSNSKEHVSGMLAASHLLGAGGAMDSLENQDANKVKGIDYYILGQQAVIPFKESNLEDDRKESEVTNEFIVKKGDNLFNIAQATGLKLSELKEANPQLRERKEDYSLIYEGEKINLPSTSEDTNFLDDISAAVKRAGKAAAKLRKGGDVGQYFEGQVEGKGDGMSDEIPFQVENGNPDFAMLSKDEYVIPADVVAMLGNGSSDAGADKLDDFLEDTREEAFGRKEQQTKIDAEKGLSSLA